MGVMTRRRLISVAKVLLVVSVSFILYEAVVSHPINPHVEGGDKILHFLAFYVLAMLADFSFPDSRFGITKMAMLMGFGMLIEYEQSFIPWRRSDLMDLVADAAGMFAYLLTIPILLHIPLLKLRWNR